MFGLCRQSTRAEERIEAQHQGPMGRYDQPDREGKRDGAPSREPNEMYFVRHTVTKKITADGEDGNGSYSTGSAPRKLATALPPLKRRNTGKTWPSRAATAAALVQAGSPSVSRAREIDGHECLQRI